MPDYIDRQMAIKEAYTIAIDGETYDVVQVETLMGLPSYEPTLYGYDIADLAFIAALMQKERISPTELRAVLYDVERMSRVVIADITNTMQREIERQKQGVCKDGKSIFGVCTGIARDMFPGDVH